MACGIGQELYVFGGVRSQETQDPERRQMMTCKSEFYHEEMRRLVTLLAQRRRSPDRHLGRVY